MESSLWHCGIYFLPHCFSLHLQRLRAILAIQFSSEGGPPGPFLLPASCVFVRWAVDSQICSLCNDGWLVEIIYRVDWGGQWERVSRSWQGGAQALWDQSPSYFIRQTCFSADSRGNGAGVARTAAWSQVEMAGAILFPGHLFILHCWFLDTPPGETQAGETRVPSGGD